jgi:hypothetical protein
MKPASLLRYELHKLRESLRVDNGGDISLAFTIERKQAQLVIAERRELKRLARYLTFKADIYGPTGRIYSCDAKWTVRDGKLFHGNKVIDPNTLTDGHGRTIDPDSNY